MARPGTNGAIREAGWGVDRGGWGWSGPSPSVRKCTPAMLRPRATLEASLWSSPTIVTPSSSALLSAINSLPSADANMAGHFLCGHGLRKPSGVTVAIIALMTVTHAPATTAWPDGHEGCVGDPSAYCSAR